MQLSLEHPINYVVLGDPLDPGRPPSTGLVVWLQYMVAASMHHKVCEWLIEQ